MAVYMPPQKDNRYSLLLGVMCWTYSEYVCVYVCVYVHVCIYIYVCKGIGIGIGICICVNIYILIYIVYIYIYVYTYTLIEFLQSHKRASTVFDFVHTILRATS